MLSKSLQATGTQYPFFVMTGPGVSKTVMSRLKTVSTGVIPVTSIENTNDGHEASWRNSEFLKLNIWNLTIFEQIVYLDADTLVLESIDDVSSSSVKAELCIGLIFFCSESFLIGTALLQLLQMYFLQINSMLVFL